MDFTAFQSTLQGNARQDGVAARFYDKAVKTGKLNADGLPIFANRCFVEIRIKDNNCEIFDQPATPEKINRFPVEYARYQMSKKQVENGTPLEQFAFLTAAEIESLKVRGVFTVEALADLPEDKAEQLELTHEREAAQKFAANARDYKNMESQRQKEERYLAEIKALKNELYELKRNSVPKYGRRR